MEINKGEIWEVEHGRYVKTAIVLAHHGSYCSVIVLDDEYRESRDIQIKARGMKYSESGFVQYKFTGAFITFVRKLTDEEFEDVREKVANSLGFGTGTMEASEEIEVLKTKLEELEKSKLVNENALKLTIKTLKEEYDELKKSSAASNPAEVIALKTERDLYKYQYEMLLERLIGA